MFIISLAQPQKQTEEFSCQWWLQSIHVASHACSHVLLSLRIIPPTKATSCISNIQPRIRPLDLPQPTRTHPQFTEGRGMEHSKLQDTSFHNERQQPCNCYLGTGTGWTLNMMRQLKRRSEAVCQLAEYVMDANWAVASLSGLLGFESVETIWITRCSCPWLPSAVKSLYVHVLDHSRFLLNVWLGPQSSGSSWSPGCSLTHSLPWIGSSEPPLPQ